MTSEVLRKPRRKSPKPPKEFRVVIFGSRTFCNYTLLKKVMNDMTAKLRRVIVVSGNAYGADTLGQKWAMEWFWPMEIHRADWKKHGRKAGMIRNMDMAEVANAGVAFWDGRSRGTKDMIDRLKRKGKKVKVIRFKEKEARDPKGLPHPLGIYDDRCSEEKDWRNGDLSGITSLGHRRPKHRKQRHHHKRDRRDEEE